MKEVGEIYTKVCTEVINHIMKVCDNNPSIAEAVAHAVYQRLNAANRVDFVNAYTFASETEAQPQQKD